MSASLSARLRFHPYSRRFRSALFTPLGVWSSRLGLVVRLEAGDRVAYGDITPIPWFACESFDEAFQFCSRWRGPVTEETIAAIPATLPATRFGLGWAWEQLQGHPWGASHPAEGAKGSGGCDRADDQLLDPTLGDSPQPHGIPGNTALDPAQPNQNQLHILPSLPLGWLLPQGNRALDAWQDPWDQGWRTFKLKVGDGSWEQELTRIETLRRGLPEGGQLRLDANGKLTLEQAHQLLALGDRLGEQGYPLEFVEQPLPPEAWMDLQALERTYATPIALDESVTTVTQLRHCQDQGWGGIFVLKPSLAGFPWEVRALWEDRGQEGGAHNLGKSGLDLVMSSALETAIGHQAAMTLAHQWHQQSHAPRAAGLGVQGFLEQDGLDSPTAGEVWKFVNFLGVGVG
jgi:o-succinylbenzoate synthase